MAIATVFTAQPNGPAIATLVGMSLALACSLTCVLTPPPPPPAEVPDSFTAPPSTVPDPVPVAVAPLDDETPQPSGLAIERRLYRKMEQDTGLDLSDAWDDYEEDHEGGLRRSFARAVRQRYRNRRGGGIAITIGGLVFSAGSSIYWIYVVGGSEVYEGRIAFTVVGVGVNAIGVAAISVGAWMWSRNQARLNVLRDTGHLAGGPRLRLRSIAPLVLPRGAGLGLRLAF